MYSLFLVLFSLLCFVLNKIMYCLLFLVLWFELVLSLFVILLCVLSSRLLFWWFVVLLVLLVIIARVLCWLLSNLLLVLASPSTTSTPICCGPSAKPGRQQIRRAINRLYRLRSVFMAAQPGLQPAFPTRTIGRARPHTSSTPYNHTQPSAPILEDLQ